MSGDVRIPQDHESEQSLLGAMLMRHCAIAVDWDYEDVRAIVGSESFHTPQHRTLFKAIFEAHEAGEPIEWLSIIPRLEAADGATNWQETCSHLTECFADSQNALFYARRVRRAHLKRRIMQAAMDAIERAGDDLVEPEEIVADLATTIERIDAATVADREPTFDADLLRGLVNPANDPTRRIPVGIGQLGDVLDGGVERGTLTVVGAAPSRGKTSLGLRLCLDVSGSSDGCPTMFVSAEMTGEQVAHRILAMRSGVPVSRIRAGDLEDSEFSRERNRAAVLADSEINSGRGLLVIDGVNDARAIAALIRRATRRRGIGMVVVDYLGRLDLAGEFDRHDLKVGTIAKMCKTTALEANVAIVLACQLSRSSINDGRKPRLSDLRDSGMIEAEADNVILIYVPDNQCGDVSETTLIVAKQRQGQTGEARVAYRKATMLYEGLWNHPTPGVTRTVAT